MQNLLQWLSRHKNQAYLAVFLLITLPAVGLYYWAQSKPTALALLAIIILGNLLVVLIR
jgi:hypothetical protein